MLRVSVCKQMHHSQTRFLCKHKPSWIHISRWQTTGKCQLPYKDQLVPLLYIKLMDKGIKIRCKSFIWYRHRRKKVFFFRGWGGFVLFCFGENATDLALSRFDIQWNRAVIGGTAKVYGTYVLHQGTYVYLASCPARREREYFYVVYFYYFNSIWSGSSWSKAYAPKTWLFCCHQYRDSIIRGLFPQNLHSLETFFGGVSHFGGFL